MSILLALLHLYIVTYKLTFATTYEIGIIIRNLTDEKTET